MKKLACLFWTVNLCQTELQHLIFQPLIRVPIYHRQIPMANGESIGDV